MLLKTCCCLFFSLPIDVAIGQQFGPPPLPPPPPAFTGIKGLPLSCFYKPAFEEDGLEFFVCNGGGGIAGVRKKIDPAHTIFVRDPELAQNLNMKAAKGECSGKQFFVKRDPDGIISFGCQGKEIDHREKFQTASKAEWKKYDNYLK